MSDVFRFEIKKVKIGVKRKYNCIYFVFISLALEYDYSYSISWGYPRGVMVKAMDCGIVVREFVLQSRYYVHFLANTLGKVIRPLILPSMG